MLEVTPQVTNDKRVVLDDQRREVLPGRQRPDDRGRDVLHQHQPRPDEGPDRRRRDDRHRRHLHSGDTESEDGVPGFSTIPVLGWLFKNEDERRAQARADDLHDPADRCDVGHRARQRGRWTMHPLRAGAFPFSGVQKHAARPAAERSTGFFQQPVREGDDGLEALHGGRVARARAAGDSRGDAGGARPRSGRRRSGTRAAATRPRPRRPHGDREGPRGVRRRGPLRPHDRRPDRAAGEKPRDRAGPVRPPGLQTAALPASRARRPARRHQVRPGRRPRRPRARQRPRDGRARRARRLRQTAARGVRHPRALRSSKPSAASEEHFRSGSPMRRAAAPSARRCAARTPPSRPRWCAPSTRPRPAATRSAV